MALMKQIKSAVRNYFLHILPCVLYLVVNIAALHFFYYYFTVIFNYNIDQAVRHYFVKKMIWFCNDNNSSSTLFSRPWQWALQ